MDAMFAGSGSKRSKKRMLRFIFAATFASLNFGTYADAQAVKKPLQQKADEMIGRTFLFRNNSDRVPQVEYFRADGKGAIWSAKLGNQVVPVEWAMRTREDGSVVMCVKFDGAYLGLPGRPSLCDPLSVVRTGIRDARYGDVYHLMKNANMNIALPQDVMSLRDVDRVLKGG